MTNISVILVSGGHPYDTVGRSVELLYTNGSRICSLPDLPYTRYHHSQTRLTACGGWGDAASKTSCHTLSSSGSWEETHSLDQERRQHSAWASPQGVMLLGGVGSSAHTTSEILLESGDTSPGFSLDYWTK